MARTSADWAATHELADAIETLAKIAVVKMLAAEQNDDRARYEFYDRLVDGYTQLAVLLDNFEQELKAQPQLASRGEA